jgi:hypothetical protein
MRVSQTPEQISPKARKKAPGKNRGSKKNQNQDSWITFKKPES